MRYVSNFVMMFQDWWEGGGGRAFVKLQGYPQLVT